MTALQEIQEATDRVVAAVAPSVVGLSRGSGLVVGPGRVLTSAHNVRGEETRVSFRDGERRAGRLAGVDVDGDLAVLAVETGATPPVPLGEAVEVRTGTPVFALADPYGRGLRVTFGLVSALDRSFRGPRGRQVTGTVEHTAPLTRGSGGGPLVDADGRLVGLNTVRLDGGLILALRADAALRDRVEALAQGQAPARTTLGVAVVPPRAARRMRRAVGLPERDGLLVRHVLDGGPAAAAGVQSGDLIVAVGDRPLGRLDDLFAALDAHAGDAPLPLTVVRGVEERRLDVPVAGAGA